MLLWSITPADEVALDRYEGWPQLYRKKTVRVKLDGTKVEAMTYIMNPGRSLGRPSGYYFDVIEEGYAAANIDIDPLYKALRDSI